MAKDQADISGGDNNHAVAADQLRAFVERIERMNEEKSAIVADIKEIYAEAKGTGFDSKVLRKLISARAKDVSALKEERAIIGLYAAALGMDEGIFG